MTSASLGLNKVITIDNERIKSHLDRVVRGSVVETLNALLDAEADRHPASSGERPGPRRRWDRKSPADRRSMRVEQQGRSTGHLLDYPHGTSRYLAIAAAIRVQVVWMIIGGY